MLFGQNGDDTWSDDSYDVVYTNGCTKRVHGKRSRKSQGSEVDTKRVATCNCNCQAACCNCQVARN
jgi:hypothetical protein